MQREAAEILEERLEERLDVRLELRIKNNVLWHAIYDRYGSIAELCRQVPALKQFYQRIVELVSFRRSPLGRNGEYRDECELLGSFLGAPVSDLFPRALYERVKTPTRVLEVSSLAALPSAVRKEIRSLPAPVRDPSAGAECAELREHLRRALRFLPPRQLLVLQLRYGFRLGDVGFIGDRTGMSVPEQSGPLTLDQTAQHVGRTRERIRQIEMRALRKIFLGADTQLLRSILKTYAPEQAERVMREGVSQLSLSRVFEQLLELCRQ